MIYNDGSTTTLYYYVLNAQGDVIALLNSAGSLVASYNYGAWGNYSVHDKDGKKTTDATFIGHINPLRYRGYYYDRETRLYYLQSRYYDFANCRFINADGLFADSFIGTNLFAYCVNNPVNTVDYTGNFAITVTAALLAIGLAAIVTALTAGICSSPGFQDAVNSACEAAFGATLLTPGAIGYGIGGAVTKQTASVPKAKEKQEIQKEPDPPVLFPVDPNAFNPVGLIKVHRPGTKNGAIISWMDPYANVEIFRWDENPNYLNEPHYHIHGTGHYYPGMIVPEPYATTYFRLK